jgi:hypothetical protein
MEPLLHMGRLHERRGRLRTEGTNKEGYRAKRPDPQLLHRTAAQPEPRRRRHITLAPIRSTSEPAGLERHKSTGLDDAAEGWGD